MISSRDDQQQAEAQRLAFLRELEEQADAERGDRVPWWMALVPLIVIGIVIGAVLLVRWFTHVVDRIVGAP